MIINRNREIHPCFAGATMGIVGEDLLQIKQRIVDLAARIQQLRGCVRCPVKAFCSKCIFPYPLSPSDFCRINLEMYRKRGHFQPSFYYSG
jgi:hypothetical protein